MVSSRSRPLALGLLLLWACHPPTNSSGQPPPAPVESEPPSPPEPIKFVSLEVEQTGPFATAPLDLPVCGEVPTGAYFHDVAVASPTLFWGLTQGGIQSIDSTTSPPRTVDYDEVLDGTGYSGLQAISAPSETAAWAVGTGGRILRWDGTSWSAEASHTTEVLRTVWADASGEAWAGGDSGTLLHRGEGSWTVVSSVIGGDIQGMWGSRTSGVWAVASSGEVLHWNGKTWSTVITGAGDLKHIQGSSADNIWVAWYDYPVGNPATRKLLHWNGTRWTQVEWIAFIPVGFGASATLTSLWVRGQNDVWVGGFLQYTYPPYEDTTPKPPTYEHHTRHWDGQNWNEVPFSSSFKAVWNGDTWVVFVGDRFLRLCP